MPHPILDRPPVLQALFHPRRDSGRVPPGVHLVSVDVEPGVAVGGRLYPAGPAAPAAPAILYFHGNGEIAADYDGFAPVYAQLDITLLVMDYRGYGRSGGVPTVSNLLTDAVAAFDAVDGLFQDHGLAPARLYVMGRSLGSASAIEVALHAGDRLAGLILESGFSDTFALLKRLGLEVRGLRGRPDEAEDGLGNAPKMERVTISTLIIHGQADVLIPAADGQELYRRCAAAHKRLVLIPSAGHNDLLVFGAQQYFGAIREFVVG